MKKIVLCINLCVFTLGFLSMINKIIDESILFVGEYQCVNKLNKVISEIVAEEIDENIGNEIFYTDENKLEVNTYILNSLTLVVSKKIEDAFYKINSNEFNENFIFYIPLFENSKNKLLRSYGPKIPFKYDIGGNVQCNIVTSISDYGINNCLLKIDLKLISTYKTIVPVKSEEKTFDYIFPLAIRVIEGEIPNFFVNNY